MSEDKTAVIWRFSTPGPVPVDNAGGNTVPVAKKTAAATASVKAAITKAKATVPTIRFVIRFFLQIYCIIYSIVLFLPALKFLLSSVG